MSEDNQKLRPNCPPDYQSFSERIDPKMFILPSLSSYLSLTNKNSSLRIYTRYIQQGNKILKGGQNNDEDDQIFNFSCPLTTNFWIEFCYPGL